MFPSSGYFRSLVCPFFASGLCERPYCHFRHSRAELERTQSQKTDTGPSYSTSSITAYQSNNALGGLISSSATNLDPKVPSSGSSLPLAPGHTQAGVYSSSVAHSSAPQAVGNQQGDAETNLSIPSFSSSEPSLPTSDREPSLDRELLPEISGLPKPKNLPSYVPTPKSQTNVSVSNTVPSYRPTPKSLVCDNGKRASNVIEYDPIKNFASWDKGNKSAEEEEAAFSDDDDDAVPQPSSNDEKAKPQDNASEKKIDSTADEELTDSDEDVTWKGPDGQEHAEEEPKTSNLADLLTPSSYFTEKLSSTSSASTKSKGDILKDTSQSNKSSITSTDTDCVGSGKTDRVESSLKSTLKSKSISGDSEKSSYSSKKSSSSSSKLKTSGVFTNLPDSTTGKSSESNKNNHKSSKPSSSSSSVTSSSSSSKKAHKSPSSSLKNYSSSSVTSSSSNREHKSSSSSSHKSSSSHHKSSSSSKKHSSSSSSTHKLSISDRKDSKSSSKERNGHPTLKSSSSSHSHVSDSKKDLKLLSTERNTKSPLRSSSSSVKSHSSSSEKENKHLEKALKSHSSSHKSSSLPRSLSSTSCTSSLDSAKQRKHRNKSDTCAVKDEVKGEKSSFGQEGTDKSKSSSVTNSRSEKKLNHDNSIKVNGITSSKLKAGKNSKGSKSYSSSSSKNKKDIIHIKSSSSSADSPKTSSLQNDNIDSDSDIEIIEPPPVSVTVISDSDDDGHKDETLPKENCKSPREEKSLKPAVVQGSQSEEEADSPLDSLMMEEEEEFMSDGDTFDECLRIFNESEKQLAEKRRKGELQHDPNKGKSHEAPKAHDSAEDLLVTLGRKRMAHENSTKVSRPHKSLVSSRPKLSPAEVMHNRIVEMQKRALLRAARREGREADLPTQLSSPPPPSHGGRLNILGGGLPAAGSNTSTSATRPPKTSSSIFTDKAGRVGPDHAASPILSRTSSSSSSLTSSNQRQRQAHTPKLSLGQKTPPRQNIAESGGFMSLNKSSTTMSPNSFYNKKPSQAPATKEVTIAGTASKTEKRKAHEPTLSNLKRPLIPAEFGGKVPTNVRQRYLNLIIDEHLKFRPEQEAYTKGEEDEKAVYTKATNKNIYLRVAVNAITRIRSEAALSLPSSSKKPCLDPGVNNNPHMAQSHAATLGGRNAVRHSYTLNRSKGIMGTAPAKIEGKEFYERLNQYILSEDKLRENGFPRLSEDGGSKVKFYKEEDTSEQLLKENERVCRRCGKRFTVNKEGDPISRDICVYHYGGVYKKRHIGTIESRHSCCNEKTGTKGCQVANLHVHERNKRDNLTGYMTTMPASSTSDKNYKVYSLDCEMVYTKAGLELARVTVVGEDCEVVYESLVKPDAEIVDYNTKFSGITAADMRGVTTTIRGVQAVMLSMISDKTILMGHSLESDLVALKMIHSTVVDTSVVFPHRLGPPYKRALRHLMLDHLQKIIQADDAGHDSKEDAAACMQLMKYKVKEDAKREYRRF